MTVAEAWDGDRSPPPPRHAKENGMQIQVHTDRNVDVSAGIIERIEAELESALSRFSDQITRVEVHLGDESAGRSGGADKRCMLEARPAGQQPVAVTHHAASVA